ncbi:MAG: penicillin-binding protein [Dysgonomonas sp.]
MAVKNQNRETNKGGKKRTIINRYGLIVILLSLFFLVVIGFIIKIMYVEGDFWRELGENVTVKKDREVLPVRGNIYADDGRLLAASQPLYGIYVDFMSEGMKQDSLVKYVDGLSQALAKKYPDKSVREYKKIMMDGWKLSRKEIAQIEAAKRAGSDVKIPTRSRYVRIIKRDINYLELRELRTYPFFNQKSNRSGLIAEEKTMREKPFGRLAGRTIGSIYKDISMGGASGIEKKCDSVLKGETGLKSRQKIQGQWIDVVDVPAVDGWDVQTTIDIDIQDITERALYDKLAETEAESGCAVIMDVETGEIKAISNLDRVSPGVYAEGNPNVFSYMSEPGSTFKTISLVAALEDGVVTPSDQFFAGNGVLEHNGRLIRDHDWRKGKEKGYMTVAEGMYNSSNVVISQMIMKGYGSNPAKYVEHIYNMGLTKKIDWDVPLKGIEGTAIIKHPNDKSKYWSKVSLAWMSFGYETQVPPIYLLMFYNGIANGGKMIKPFIIKSYLKDGQVVKNFDTEVINPALCSAKTLKEVQDILVGVVNEGTGKAVASKDFQIAGKTGTADIASGGSYGSGYYVSFCGYFPADKPRYTCFVGVRRPKGIPSGGGMSGQVFKNIAEAVYARELFQPVAAVLQSDTIVRERMPYIKAGSYKGLQAVLSGLNIKYVYPTTESAWVLPAVNYGQIVVKPTVMSKGTVPDVKGMGARDAVFALENAGLRVQLKGSGKVTNQSIEPNTRLVVGSLINIELN